MSRGDEAAHPVSTDPSGSTHYGLSIREHFAAMAMQGLANCSWTWDESRESEAAKVAVRLADALLAELAKP